MARGPKYSVRYSEIIEGTGAAEVWKQTKRTVTALRALRSKQQGVVDARTAARALPAGQERVQRLQAADRRDADARRVYNNTLNSANDAMRDALAKAKDQ